MRDDDQAGQRRRRPGRVYNNAMKILADHDLGALLTLVGIHEPATRLDGELASSSRTADLVVSSGGGIVHVEFVKDLTPDLDLRMVDYRLRLRRRDRTKPISQYVLALGGVRPPERYDDVDVGALTCRWTVVRLDELDPDALLRTPTTAALAALARGDDAQRIDVLTAAAELIVGSTDPERGDLLLDAAATLASIVLPRSTIVQALKEATMPVRIIDTPLGRAWYEEGREEGERQAVLRITRIMLGQRFGTDDPRLDAIAAHLALLPDDERLARLAAATSLDELAAGTQQ
jgi:hypothetical protein